MSTRDCSVLDNPVYNDKKLESFLIDCLDKLRNNKLTISEKILLMDLVVNMSIVSMPNSKIDLNDDKMALKYLTLGYYIYSSIN